MHYSIEDIIGKDTHHNDIFLPGHPTKAKTFDETDELSIESLVVDDETVLILLRRFQYDPSLFGYLNKDQTEAFKCVLGELLQKWSVNPAKAPALGAFQWIHVYLLELYFCQVIHLQDQSVKENVYELLEDLFLSASVSTEELCDMSLALYNVAIGESTLATDEIDAPISVGEGVAAGVLYLLLLESSSSDPDSPSPNWTKVACTSIVDIFVPSSGEGHFDLRAAMNNLVHGNIWKPMEIIKMVPKVMYDPTLAYDPTLTEEFRRRMQKLQKQAEEDDIYEICRKIKSRAGPDAVERAKYIAMWTHYMELDLVDWSNQKIEVTSKLSLTLGDFADDEKVSMHLFVLCKLIELTQGFFPRFTQVVSCAILLLSEETRGCLVEIATGEGKSCIIAMLASMLAKSGKFVDIVTSSPELARRDVENWSEYYSKCGLSVSHNVDLKDDGERTRCYKHNVVYGTVGSFASDNLRQDFHQKCIKRVRCEGTCAAIVDEVDFMMLDQGVQFTYLSNKCLGFRHIEPVFALIWNAVNRYEPIVFENETHFHDKPQPFYEILENVLTTESERTTLQILEMAEEAGLLEKGVSNQVEKEGATGDYMSDLNSDKMLEIFKIAKEDIHKGLEVYTIGEQGLTKVLSPSEADAMHNECPVAVVLLDKGLCISVIKDEQMLQAGIAAIVLEHVNGKKGEQRIKIPKHLKEYVEDRTEVWVKSCFHSLSLKSDREYIIKDGKVLPVDFKSTGTVEIDKKWGGGLQQFVELKHGLQMSPVSLVTNFMSNITLFGRYGGDLYGVSGTLGSETDQRFLEEEFNVDLHHVPSHKESRLYEEQGKVLPTESEWLCAITEEVQCEVSANPWRENGRAALVICEDIRTADLISEKLHGEVPGRIYTYTGTGEGTDKLPKRRLKPGDVIVATNLAGRGTDIVVAENVNEVGGLFVLVTFLPSNTRVERQAFGRTGRRGLPGSAKVMVNLESLPMVYRGNAGSIDGMRAMRNELQKEWYHILGEGELKKCKAREAFFEQYCFTLSHIRKKLMKVPTDDDTEDIIFSYLHEQWGMWLQRNSESSKESIEDRMSSLARAIHSAAVDLRDSKIQNVYPFIQWGNKFLFHEGNQSQSYIEIASSYYEKAIKADKQWASIAYYNNAYCKIKKGGKHNMQLAEDDLRRCLKKLKNYKVELMQILTNAKLDKSREKSEELCENSLSASIESRQRVLDSFERNVQQSISKLKSLKERGEEACAESKTLIVLVDTERAPESQREQMRVELIDLWQHGLEFMFAVNKKPSFCWSGLAVCLMGIAQVALGVCLVAVSGGFLCTLGKAFIEEGISDMYEGIKGMINGDFDWAAWGIAKAMSLAISIATMGVGSILSKGSKALSFAKGEAKKAFKETVQQLKELPGALRQQFGTGVVTGNMRQAFNAAGKEVAEQGVIELANYGADELVDAMMDKVEDSVVYLVEENVRKSSTSGEISKEIDRVALLMLCGSSESIRDPMIQQSMEKTFKDMSRQVTDSFRRDPEWVALTQEFIFGVVNKLSQKPEHKESKTFGIFKNTLKTSILAVHGSRAAKETSQLLESFESRLSCQVHEHCKKHRVEQEEANVLASNVRLSKLKTKIGKDIAKILSSTIRDIWQNNFVRSINSEIKRKFNQEISIKTREKLKTENSFQKAEAGVTKFHAASMSPDIIAPSESAGRGVRKHIDDLLSGDKPASVTDARILAEQLGRRIEIVQDDENGSPLIRTGKETKQDAIKLVYEEPSEHNQYGHYNAVVNGKLITVKNTDRDCLYHAIAVAEGTSPADLPKRVAELKRIEAEELEANPERWSSLMERTECARAISSQIMLVGAAPKVNLNNVGEVHVYGQVGQRTGVQADHQPASSTVRDGVKECQEKQKSPALIKKLEPLVDRGGKTYSNNHLLSVVLSTREHRYLLTTGSNTECRAARELIKSAIVDGDAEEMLKLTFLASSTDFAKSVKETKKAEGSIKYPGPNTNYKEQCLGVLNAWRGKLKPDALTDNQYNEVKSWIERIFDNSGKIIDKKDKTYKELYKKCTHAIQESSANKGGKDDKPRSPSRSPRRETSPLEVCVVQ